MKERPQIGDMVKIATNTQSRYAGKNGIVRKIRARKDGYWTAAEIELDGQRRWFVKGELERIVRSRPPSPPPGDFVRIERRTRHRNAVALHLYIGRALLYRWQETTGVISRVDVRIIDGQLAIHADPQGPYALDAAAYRQPRIHCDRARTIVTLPDGRYKAHINGPTLIIDNQLEG